MIKKTAFVISVLTMLFLSVNIVSAKNISGNWHNDLRTLFLNNNAIIYTINIRTFNAKDKNGNEIIDNDEESGNFINAVDELDNLVKMGINTIHVLPITPVGKIKAYGTAGSLYAITNFTEINPQLVSKKSSSSPLVQVKRFIAECHKRNIRVISDMPSCGGYDLYLEHPEYFVKDESGDAIIPCDWSDVRLLDCGSETQPNKEVLTLYKKYTDMIIELGFDGIRADVARLKHKVFWENLIKYARAKDSEFLFIAEASKLWNEPLSKYAPNTSVDDLFKAGFDGYLGNYFNLKNMKTAKELITTVEEDLKFFKKYDNKKSVIGSFSTHDIISPVLINGSNFSKMIIWLNTTLPLNSYYIDGFPTGDTYNYQWANKFAENSQTDDTYYFTHNGQIDIFNFSRKPGGNDFTIYNEFVLANKFKSYYARDLATAKFTPLKSSNPKVFAYARVANNMSVIVIGNLDFSASQEALIKIPGFKSNMKIINMRIDNKIENEYSNNKILSRLEAGDIQVLLIKKFTF